MQKITLNKETADNALNLMITQDKVGMVLTSLYEVDNGYITLSLQDDGGKIHDIALDAPALKAIVDFIKLHNEKVLTKAL